MERVRVVRVVQAGGRGAGEAWQVVGRQPSWISRAVLTLFLLLVALPFLLLFLLAIALATILFVVLAGVNAVLTAGRSLFGGGAGGTGGGLSGRDSRSPRGPPGNGRENVRVIRRD